MARPYAKLSGVRTNSLGNRMIALVEKYYPKAIEIYVTSSIRNGDPGYHGSRLTYGGSATTAVDFGAYDDPEPNSKDQRDMGELADWLFAHFWDLTIELIHTQPHNNHFTYVKNQRRVGAYATADHVNHIHWATSYALMSKIEARAKAKWGTSAVPKKPTTSTSSKYNNTTKPIYGIDVYDFTVNDGLTEANVKDLVRKGGISFLNAKIAEIDRNGNKWVHTKALRMLNVARSAGLPFPMGFVVPRTGVSAATLWSVAEDALNKHCPWWRTDPAFSIQVDTEKWEYDPVSLDKGVEVAKHIRDKAKRRVVAVYAPDWGYEGSRGPISKIKSAGFNWWSSEYRGTGSHTSIYSAAGGNNHPGWRVVDGVTPTLNQFSQQGRVPGYGKNLVVTAYKGTQADFAKMLGIKETIEEDDPLAAIQGDEKEVLEKIGRAVWLGHKTKEAIGDKKAANPETLLKYSHAWSNYGWLRAKSTDERTAVLVGEIEGLKTALEALAGANGLSEDQYQEMLATIRDTARERVVVEVREALPDDES